MAFTNFLNTHLSYNLVIPLIATEEKGNLYSQRDLYDNVHGGLCKSAPNWKQPNID